MGAAALVTEENLAEDLNTLRPKLFGDDSLLRQYAWASKAFPQYHVAMYVLLHLCLKPGGFHLQKAWETVDAQELWGSASSSSIGFGSKFAVLAALKAKAEAIRGRIQTGSGVGSSGHHHQGHHHIL